MLTFNIITVLPELFSTHFTNRPFKPALAKNLISTNVLNLRDFPVDTYGSIDEKPYGGGVGMILRPEPIYQALLKIYGTPEAVEKVRTKPKHKIVLLSPKGKVWNQKLAQEYKSLENITFICGRYEGIDYRIEKLFATDVISVGDYVLTGGELPALTIMESITRLLPDVIEKDFAIKDESYSINEKGETYLEYPQYTRPEIFMGERVPEVLLNGDHKKIQDWKNQNSIIVKG